MSSTNRGNARDLHIDGGFGRREEMQNVYLVTSNGISSNPRAILAQSAKEAIMKWENQNTDTRPNCNIASEVKLIASNIVL